MLFLVYINREIDWELLTLVAKVLACLLDTLRKGLLSFTDPNTGVVVLPSYTTISKSKRKKQQKVEKENPRPHLLIRFIRPFGVPNLTLQIPPLLLHIITYPSQVRKLRIGIHVHLHHPVPHRRLDLLLRRPGPTMEDEEERFRVFPAQLRGGVCLVLCEQFGVEADVPWFVYPVDVPKGSGDGEVGADSVKCLVHVEDIFRLSVQRRVIHTRIVHPVLLPTRDPDLHLEPEVVFSHLGEILDADGDVFLLGLFGEVEHVGGEKGLAVLREVGGVGFEHTVEPLQELLGAMVGVENDRAGDY